MLFQVYLRRGLVYVPTTATREGGAYTAIEPVAVVPVTRSDEIHGALLDAIGRKNVTVPVPKGKWPAPVLLKYADVKNWSDFAHDASTWYIQEEDSEYQICGYRMNQKGYWEEDPDQKIDFQSGTSLDTVLDQMVDILQEAAGRS